MAPDEFRAALIRVYGRRGFIASACQGLGVSRSSLWRWLSGQYRVPVTVSLALRGLLDNKR